MLELVELIRRGEQFSICVLCPEGRKYGLAEEYLRKLPKPKRDSLLNLLKRVADNGPPPNEELFRRLHGPGRGLCEFKRWGHRLIGFQVGDRFILTHGFPKKGYETPPEEISRAQSLKARYLEEMGS